MAALQEGRHLDAGRGRSPSPAVRAAQTRSASAEARSTACAPCSTAALATVQDDVLVASCTPPPPAPDQAWTPPARSGRDPGASDRLTGGATQVLATLNTIVGNSRDTGDALDSAIQSALTAGMTAINAIRSTPCPRHGPDSPHDRCAGSQTAGNRLSTPATTAQHNSSRSPAAHQHHRSARPAPRPSR